MTNPRPIYRRRPVPALGDVAAAQVDEELRRIEDWSISVDMLVGSRPESTFTCPDDDGKLIYYDCAIGQDAAAPLRYLPDNPLNPGFAAFESGADILFDFDTAVVFKSQAGDAYVGGMGNIPQAPDVLLFVATADPDQWDNIATRRELFIGGGEVTFDAGTSMQLLLPGVEANQFGYDLQLAPDGATALAVPLPQPDFSAEDTSNDDGTTLISGTGAVPWTIFPDGSDTQPGKLEVTIPDPQEPGEVVMRVKLRVLNTTSNRTGTITIGVGADGATPLPDDQQTFVIPAGFSGALDMAVVFTFSETTSAPVVMTVWFQGSGDHNQFNLETDNAEGQHQLEVSISRGGGGTQPPITDHQLLTNRDPVAGGAHMASSISFDDTFTTPIRLEAANVQEAFEDHVEQKANRHNAVDIFYSDQFHPYAFQDIGEALSKHVITGLDPLYTDKHPAQEISFSSSAGLTSDEVRAALDELKGLIDALGAPGGYIGWGGWTKVNANDNLGPVSTNFVEVSPVSPNALPGNTNVSFAGSTGWVAPGQLPTKRLTLHASLAFEVSNDCKIRIGFRSNLTPFGQIVGGAAEAEAYHDVSVGTDDLNHISLSIPGPIDSSALWYVAIRCTGGTSATIVFQAGSFWLEYE